MTHRRTLAPGCALLCLLIFTSFSVWPAALPGDRFLISKWETVDGLPENSATAMAQTPDGYLWFGTFNGLVRFDGARFVVFNTVNTPILPNNAVVNLHVDRGGRLWFSTYRGLVSLLNGEWKRIGVQSSWTNRIVRDFAEGPGGEIYATSFDGAVCRLQGENVIELPTPPGPPGEGRRCQVDAAGTLWLWFESLLCHWSGSNWVSSMEGSTAARQFESVVSNHRGEILVLSKAAVHRLNNGRLTRTTPLSEPLNAVWSALETRDGAIWVASYRRGLYRIDSAGRVERWSESEGLTQNALRFAFEDQEGNLWVGSSGGGLMQLRPRSVWTFDSESTLPNRVVKSLWEEAPGRLLVATYGGNVVRLEGQKSGVINKTTEPAQAYAQCVRTDRAGNIWMGFYGGGLVVLEPGGTRRVVPASDSGGTRISALFEDSAGRMWIGGDAALSVHDGGRFLHPLGTAGAAAGGVTCFAENPADHSVWAIEPAGGLHRLAGLEVTRVPGPGGRPIESGVHLYFDRDQNLWVATETSGLWRTVAPGKSGSPIWSQVSSRNGLVTDSVSSVLQDDLGDFWLGSNRGLMRVSQSSLQAVAEGKRLRADVRSFTVADGLASLECPSGFQPNAIRDSRRRLWFATLKGVAMVDPAALAIHTNPPPVLVESLGFVDREGGRHALGVRSGDRIEILPGGTEISLAFTALHLAYPEKIRFICELKRGGRVLNRVETAARMSTFALLPPGEYEFRVSAVNADGVWSQSPASLRFAVLPFFWQTNWFRWLAVLGLLSGGGGIVWRVLHRRLEQQEQSSQQQQALRESEQALRAFMDALPEPALMVDRQGSMLMVNHALARSFGCSPAELIGRDAFQLMSPEIAAKRKDAVETVLASGRPLSFEDTRGERHFINFMSPVQGDDGKPRRVAVFAMDISERKHAEEALQSLASGTAGFGPEFFRSLVKNLARAFEVRYALVGELLPNERRVRAISVWANGQPGESFEYDLQDTPCDNVIGQTICIHREGVQDLFPQDLLLREMGVESYMGAPLFDRSGRPLGILVVLHDKPLVDPPHFHTILAIFASRAGAELERMRAEEALRMNEQDLRDLAGRLMEVQDDERRRIGRDLHDSTGQALAALEINLAMARRNLANAPGEIQRLMDDCMTLAAQSSNEIRTTSYLLHPPLLDEIGLVSALKWLADGFSKRSQIQVALKLPDQPERLPAEHELTLFRLVQESLTNVHRHSGSASAEISLFARPDLVIVEVRDSGTGIPPAELSNFRQGGTALGVGLAGMRQRIRQLGGTLEIESRPGATVVIASIPIRARKVTPAPALASTAAP